jgi:hypothetical protein
MKDNLEKFINENREKFDIHEPPDNLWKGISLPEIVKKRSAIYSIITRAAIVIFIFSASYMFHDFMENRRQNHIRSGEFYQKIPELEEAEIYYNNLVNLRIEELQPFISQIPELQKSLSGDLTELDSIYNSLKRDLSDNIANDEVIEAMIQNYRLKLEILEALLFELKNEKNEIYSPGI